jgi:heme-degrading monooxygenase HmoA
MIIAMFKAEKHANIDVAEYQKTAQRMMELVSKMPGFISFKGCTADDGETFSMATFEGEQALDAWHNHPDHRATQNEGTTSSTSHSGSESAQSFASTSGSDNRMPRCDSSRRRPSAVVR